MILQCIQSFEVGYTGKFICNTSTWRLVSYDWNYDQAVIQSGFYTHHLRCIELNNFKLITL